MVNSTCDILWHLHVPKTGGTSIAEQLGALPGAAHLIILSSQPQIKSSHMEALAHVHRKNLGSRRGAQRLVTTVSTETNASSVLRALPAFESHSATGHEPPGAVLSPPITCMFTVLRRPADWLRSALQHVAMEYAVARPPNASAAYHAELAAYLRAMVWHRHTWFATDDIQASMASPGVPELPPHARLTLFTLESGRSSEALHEAAPHAPGPPQKMACADFLATCSPHWPGDTRSEATCHRGTQLELRAECDRLAATAAEAVDSGAGRRHLSRHCQVDEWLWGRVNRSGGRLEWTPTLGRDIDARRRAAARLYQTPRTPPAGRRTAGIMPGWDPWGNVGNVGKSSAWGTWGRRIRR